MVALTSALMGATDHALLVGGFFARALVSLQAALHVHASLTVLLEKAPWFPVHLIQRTSIRSLPLRLPFDVPSYRIPVSWNFCGLPSPRR